TRFSRDWSSDVCSSDLKEEFFKKQLGAIRMYIQTFVPLVKAGGAERYLYLLQGYLLEAEKLVYRHRREGNVSASVMQELNSLYEIGRASCRSRWVIRIG